MVELNTYIKTYTLGNFFIQSFGSNELSGDYIGMSSRFKKNRSFYR